MNQSILLSLEERTALGSRAVRKIRAQGLVPAVVYGHDYASKPMMVPYPEVVKVYRQAGKHHPVELADGGDKPQLAMIKQVDIDPVKHQLRHIAFQVVKRNETVQTEVSVHIKGEGETPAEKAGLVLIKNVDTVQIEAFPRHLPEAVEVDGTKLVEAGDHLTVADITPPEGVEILSDPAQVIISAVEPAALAAANDAAAGDADEDTEVPAENGESTEADAAGNEKTDDKS